MKKKEPTLGDQKPKFCRGEGLQASRKIIVEYSMMQDDLSRDIWLEKLNIILLL